MNPVYARSEDVVFRKIADEFVLVPIRQKAVDLKSVYTLNDTGAFVWELIDGKKTAGEIEKLVLAEFDADPAAVAADTAEIISQWESLRLISRQ